MAISLNESETGDKGEVFRDVQLNASDNRQTGGTGLGLSITKSIVEKHDGTIGFDSDVDTGTTFFFTLPVTK